MSVFLGIVRYEYYTSIRRWGVWLALVAGGLFVAQSYRDLVPAMPHLTLPQWSAIAALIGNTAMPIVGGIAIADRLVRDRKLGVRELLCATPLSRRTYVLGRYVGAVLAVLTPVLLVVLATSVLFMAEGLPASLLPWTLVAFLAINVPAFLFLGAFSLACPEVLPVRIYQVLFTGYWCWATAIQKEMLPTVNGTFLGPKGDWAASAFFAAGALFAQSAIGAVQSYTPMQAALNILVLFACAAGALFAVERYLAWRARRA